MNPQPIVKVNPNSVDGISFASILQNISTASIPDLLIGLTLSCLAAFFLAGLYKRFSSTVSNQDSFARLFPLLTVTTTIVIFVVKSSLALSLGLVGALSIVRFRSAIKEPEELIYLFMCIAMGLAFGAAMPLLALLGLFFFALVASTRQFTFGKNKKCGLLLTLIAATEPHFQKTWTQIEKTFAQSCDSYSLQRVEMDDGQFQLSATVQLKDPATAPDLLSELQKTGCQVSCLYLDTTQ